ncbi:exodeoxyribonuclease-3 [Quadrisphaera granulorum]|uniref:Exodeoxyribonuclease-3 n=1 Tax=Quadrisphaera granulorum TaxID=317664 RepID=A0A316AEL3_9ACTN|nr:exodeoxyribonuclease III [Quadrisphaera granulorum]PWJ55334.1 exodeoxyribonuclease-3 [Quadrisphaera granulorum]SZE95398.1 exodeoxyribonuclease-3 [Quadrisphaera granulorum]
MSSISIATVNVNGIRAAVRRGMPAWLEQRNPDVLALQEVRADDATLTGLLEESLGGGWHVAHVEPTDAGSKGRAGVAVATRLPVGEQRTTIAERFDGTGRWVELDVETPASPSGVVTVVSVYIHSGEAGTPKQDDKMAFLDAVRARMTALHATAAAGGPQAVVCGDLNIAHTERDIKNWKGNLKKAGFLPEERAYLDAWAAQGWVDVARHLAGPVDGPYSWWSWRGQAFDRDTGWRIDAHWVTPGLAERVTACQVDRAATYAERFSDHAPVVATFTDDDGDRQIP